MNAFLRTLTGKNKTGEILHGILDIAPFPNVLNLVRLAVKDNVPKKDIPKYIWQKMDKLRLSTSLIALSLSFAVVKGWLTIDELKQLLQIVLSLI